MTNATIAVKRGEAAVCPVHNRDLTVMLETQCAECVKDFDAGKTKQIFRRLK